MDREAWWFIVHGVAKLDMTERLSMHTTKAGNQCSQVVTAYIYCPEAIINTIRINGLVSAKKGGGHHKQTRAQVIGTPGFPGGDIGWLETDPPRSKPRLNHCPSVWPKQVAASSFSVSFTHGKMEIIIPASSDCNDHNGPPTLALSIYKLSFQKTNSTRYLNKWAYIELKSFFTAREIIDKMKRQPMKQRKVFANHIFNKGLISKLNNTTP